MRRIQIFLPEDIEEREVVAMAHAVGCFVRHVNGFTFMDRVPGVVRKEPTPEASAVIKPLPIRKQR